MKLSFWAFIKDQLSAPPPLVTADLTGKTVVVLGANTGLGFQAALHFAKMSPGRLILACRSENKGKAALEKLEVTTGYKKAELWLVDLAEFASVRQFADKFERDGGRLDILVENAAVGLQSVYESTKDGWESSLQVNCLAPELLALLLLPRMLQTAKDHATTPRTVVVASGVHYWHTFEKPLLWDPTMLKTLGSEKYCSTAKMRDRYTVTKLLNVLFVRAFAARLGPATALTVNAVCPGYCYSELRRNFSGILAVFSWLMERMLAFTTEQGSRQLVWGAVAPQDLRGAYISLSHIQEPSNFVISSEGVKVQDRLWDETVEILSKVDPRVTGIVEKHLSDRS